jgi:putative transcriptional regulator
MSAAALGNRLKEHRARLGLTQAELATRVQVTRKTINTVENQVFVPSAILALKLAAVLGVPVEDVFFLEDQSSTRDQPNS